MPPRIPLLSAYVDGLALHFDAADQLMPSDFGGPLDLDVRGVVKGEKPLHRIATLGWRDIPRLADERVYSLPLIYGMYYGGAPIKYVLTHLNDIRVLELNPDTPVDGFPYPNYPTHLPYVQLQVIDRVECSWLEFSKEMPNVCQEMPCDLFVVVPPPATIGCSLWGRGGDDEGVLIVWQVDFGANETSVCAYTLCT